MKERPHPASGGSGGSCGNRGAAQRRRGLLNMAALLRAYCMVMRPQSRQLWRLFPYGHGLWGPVGSPWPREVRCCLGIRAFSAAPPPPGSKGPEPKGGQAGSRRMKSGVSVYMEPSRLTALCSPVSLHPARSQPQNSLACPERAMESLCFLVHR